MSNHTKLWHKKKAELAEKEKSLKDELEQVSTLFEGRTKTILIISLITGGIALIGYLAYRSMTNKEDEPVKKSKSSTAKKIAKAAPFGTILTERIINAGINFAQEQLNNYLKKKDNK